MATRANLAKMGWTLANHYTITTQWATARPHLRLTPASQTTITTKTHTTALQLTHRSPGQTHRQPTKPAPHTQHSHTASTKSLPQTTLNKPQKSTHSLCHRHSPNPHPASTLGKATNQHPKHTMSSLLTAIHNQPQNLALLQVFQRQAKLPTRYTTTSPC